MSDVTQILNAIEGGDPQAADKLMPLVYEELRKLARYRMAKESPDQTLQATALVHEAYIRLVGSNNGDRWKNRGHFFVVAAEAMRQILIANARRKTCVKRGGNHCRSDLDPVELIVTIPSEQLLALDDALEELAKRDPVKAELVKLRYFGGLTVSEAADVLQISSTSADRYWAYARAWLQCQIAD